jgi:hypothetical protein
LLNFNTFKSTKKRLNIFEKFPLKVRRYVYICTHNFAGMVKLVDMPDLGSGAARRVGSSPITRTKKASPIEKLFLFHNSREISHHIERNLFDLDFTKVVALFFFGFLYFFENKI